MVNASRDNGLLIIAMLCIKYGLQPADLESMARQLAEFDAVNDAMTEGKENVACD